MNVDFAFELWLVWSAEGSEFEEQTLLCSCGNDLAGKCDIARMHRQCSVQYVPCVWLHVVATSLSTTHRAPHLRLFQSTCF